MADMEAQARPIRTPTLTKNFTDWRNEIARRIFWTREEDSLWRAMFESEGWDEMTKGYEYLAKKHPQPKKLFLSMFQEIR